LLEILNKEEIQEHQADIDMQQSQIKNLQEQIFVLTENVNSLKRLIFEYLQGDDAPPPQQGGQPSNPPTPPKKDLPTPKYVPIQGTNTTGTSRTGPRKTQRGRPGSRTGGAESTQGSRGTSRRGEPSATGRSRSGQ
jgi:hypothetical protein